MVDQLSKELFNSQLSYPGSEGISFGSWSCEQEVRSDPLAEGKARNQELCPLKAALSQKSEWRTA